MRVLSRLRPALFLAAIAATAPAVFAADAAPASSTGAATSASRIGERLFLGFAQDAILVPSQWWEGELEYSNGKNSAPDIFLVRGVVAFHPTKQLEVGGDFGFGSSDASGSLPDGSGATDLDAYGKWVFPSVAANTDFSAGLILTVPTGDDTAGLGYNSFAAGLFGGVRHKLDSAVIGGHVGVRFNGDGEYQGANLNGKTSYELAVTGVFPLANQVSIVGEAQIETDRFEEIDAATQVLLGVNWVALNRGVLRGAVSAGLTDGAPNFRVILGYAYAF